MLSTFDSNRSTTTALATRVDWPEPPLAPDFTRTRSRDGRWRDVFSLDYLEHQIQPAPGGEGFVYRCLELVFDEIGGIAVKRLMEDGDEIGFAICPSYADAVALAMRWAGRAYEYPEGEGGPDDGAMEAAIPFRCPLTGHIDDTVWGDAA